jgi:DNA phosphorothioation-dependent restriction protein DptG
MKLGNSQRGRSIILMIIIFGLFGYAIFVGIKLAPEYMQFYTLKSSVDEMAKEMESRSISKAQYETLMMRRMDVNYVSVKDLKLSNNGCPCAKGSVFVYNKSRSGTEVGISYQKRVPLIANVDAVLMFEHIVKVPAAK